MNKTIQLSGCLSGVPFAGLRRLCPSGKVQILPHKSQIYSQGENGDEVFSIVRGQVKLSRVDTNGSELTTAFLGEGDLFGLQGGPSVKTADSATTKGEVHLWRSRGKEFRKIILSYPDVGLCIIADLARRQRQLETRLQSIAFKGTEARLAETFRELSGSFEKRCEHGLGMHLRLTQQELADLVGATRPVVSTILNELRKKGDLGYNHEYVCVRNIEAIERLCGLDESVR